MNQLTVLQNLILRAADAIEEGHNTENVHEELALIRELREAAIPRVLAEAA